MTLHHTCPLCGVRKAKRECPALGRAICAVCCGTKRRTEIPCPESCSYLSTARIHPAAVVQRRHERDLRFFLPLVADLSEPQSRLVLLFQAVLLRHAASADPVVLDPDVSEAAAAVAATLETARKGVIYEHQAVAVPARRLAVAWRQALIALVPPAAQVARLEEDAAAALRCVERGARTAAEVLVGDEPPVFINVLGRLMPDPSSEGPDGGGDRPAAGPGAPLIIP